MCLVGTITHLSDNMVGLMKTDRLATSILKTFKSLQSILQMDQVSSIYYKVTQLLTLCSNATISKVHKSISNGL